MCVSFNKFTAGITQKIVLAGVGTASRRSAYVYMCVNVAVPDRLLSSPIHQDRRFSCPIVRSRGLKKGHVIFQTKKKRVQFLNESKVKSVH